MAGGNFSTKLMKIGSLWAKKSRAGANMMSGVVGRPVEGRRDEEIIIKPGSKIFIFQNMKKKNPSSPGWFLMLEEPAEAIPPPENDFDFGTDEPPPDDDIPF